jgi:hypothetical protein
MYSNSISMDLSCFFNDTSITMIHSKISLVTQSLKEPK